MKNAALYLLVVGLMIGLLFQEASACSCGPTPNVLDSFEHSKNVVIAKAVALEKVVEGEKTYAVGGIRSTKMVVEKVYKGGLKVGDTMSFAQGGGGNCIWTFDEESIGQRYLFYLGEGEEKGLWVAFGCGRSNSIAGAAEDLLYLDNLDKVLGKTRISGRVSFGWNISDEYRPSVEGIDVTIIGNKKEIKLKTDKNGVYEIYDLPPGQYEILPSIPKGWQLSRYYTNTDLEDGEDEGRNKLMIKLEDKRHASVGLRFDISNSIRGTVFDPNGNVMKGVCLRLYPPTGITSDFMYEADCTKADGSFELDEIPPGSYVIVANDENEITSSEPFPTLYYPGTFDLAKASVVTVGPGIFLRQMNIHVPRMQETVTLNGSFVYSDGKPVVDEPVEFEADETAGAGSDARTTSDSSGRFSLKILKGTKGKLFGSMYTFSGEFENCPKLEKLIEQSGSEIPDITTEKIDIQADTDLYGLKVVFPFPMCAKADDDN